MPTTTSLVGGTTLPIVAGSAGQRIVDQPVDALLAFLGWTLRDTLDARLAQHAGLTKPPAVTTAVAVSDQYSFSPLEPRARKTRLPVPSLWLWWDGQSTTREWTLVQRIRERGLRCLWLFPELPAEGETQRRQGLYAAADAAFARAAERGRHPSYTWTDPVSGTVWAAGTPIARMVADWGMFSWSYVGSEPIRWGIEDTEPTAPGQATIVRSARDWPGIAARFALQEIIGPDLPADPGDVNRDLAATILGADTDTEDPITILERIAGAPDGSDELD